MNNVHPQHRRFDPGSAPKLDDPERQIALPVARILELVGIRSGMNVADIGAGSGYFSVPIAHAVHPGTVFAVDMSKEMLGKLKDRIPVQLGNITPVEASAVATTLDESSCDLVFVASVWHELDEPGAALAEFSRILRPGGLLAIIDWSPDTIPPPGPPSAHRISLTNVEETLRRHGWHIASSEACSPNAYAVIAGR
jgi:ubiquinone/menaquinone biosynthesis C-methylase UbiE